VPTPPWPPPHLASQAYGTIPRYIALANETRLGVPRHFLPVTKPDQSFRIEQERGGEGGKKGAYIHDVVEDDERCPLCLWLIAYSYLSDTPVAAEEVV